MDRFGIVAITLIAGTALVAVLVAGQFWLGAKIMGFSMKKYVAELGTTKVALIIVACIPVSYAAVFAAVKFVTQLKY